MMCEFIYDKACVGERVRQKRMELQLTQEKLAEKMDRSLRMIADIERGLAGMSIETLLRMCDVLKITPNDLLMPQKSGSSDNLEWLMNALSNSSDRVRDTAIDLVKVYLRSV